MRMSVIGGLVIGLLGVMAVQQPVASAQAAEADGFHGLTPARLLDTRSGSSTIDGAFVGAGRIEGSATVELPVLGRGGVPTTGVGAVVLNVTVTDALASSYLTVYPTGEARPGASSVNFTTARTAANAVVVDVGADGKVSFFNGAVTFPNRSTGVHLIVDVLGWLSAGSSFTGVVPARLLDSRAGAPTVDGSFSGPGPLAAGATRDVVVAGRAGIPTDAGSVALNVTAVDPTQAGYLSVWPTGQPRPTASNLNFVSGLNVPNMVIVPVGAGGSVSLYNGAEGTTQLLVDVLGWFPAGSSFNGLTPARLLDTRRDAPTVDGRFSGDVMIEPGTDNLVIAGRGGVPAAGATAVALNVTVVDPTDGGYLSVYPLGVDRPTASNVNFAAGQTVANAVIVPLGLDGQIKLFLGGMPNANELDRLVGADVIVDVLGWFAGPPTVVDPNGPSFRVDGLGPTAFGTGRDAALSQLAGLLGPVSRDETHLLPVQVPSGGFEDPQQNLAFDHPVARITCGAHTCLVFGGASVDATTFVGWSSSDERFLDANGLGVGARIAVFDDAVESTGEIICGNAIDVQTASGVGATADYSYFSAPFDGEQGYRVDSMAAGQHLRSPIPGC